MINTFLQIRKMCFILNSQLFYLRVSLTLGISHSNICNEPLLQRVLNRLLTESLVRKPLQQPNDVQYCRVVWPSVCVVFCFESCRMFVRSNVLITTVTREDIVFCRCFDVLHTHQNFRNFHSPFLAYPTGISTWRTGTIKCSLSRGHF